MARLLFVAEKTTSHMDVSDQLQDAGHQVLFFERASEGISYFSVTPVDIILLDLERPDMTGAQAVKRLRRNKAVAPIILMSEAQSFDDRLGGLAAGANDYLIKPCTYPDLESRIQTQLRRKFSPETTTLVFDGVLMNLVERTITVRGQVTRMAARSFALLTYLVRHQEEVVSREELARDVWLDDSVTKKSLIEVYINQTRTRFEKLGHPLKLQTIRGVGYRLARNSHDSQPNSS